MFGFLASIFNTLLYYPLFNGLVLIYNYLPWGGFGLSIACLTVLIRIVLYPLAAKALRSQKLLQDLQPKIQEIQQQYKHDKEKQAKETMELYRKEKINPFSGLLLTLVQLPILIALYQVFSHGLKPESLAGLYGFVANPGHINAMLFTIDLSKPNIGFALLAGILQFLQTKMLLPTPPPSKKGSNDMAAMMQKQMVYFFPFITVLILLKLPSALGLYWIVSGICSIVQQYVILNKNQNSKIKMQN